MIPRMKMWIMISVVICFSFGCASVSKETVLRCPKCGAYFSSKEGAETFESMRPGGTRR